jgi:hypothetical protein
MRGLDDSNPSTATHARHRKSPDTDDEKNLSARRAGSTGFHDLGSRPEHPHSAPELSHGCHGFEVMMTVLFTRLQGQALP